MSKHRIYPFTGNITRCPACPFGVLDRLATVEGLKLLKSGDNFGVLRVRPLASLMCTRARACIRIAVGGRTGRTKNETADINGYKPSTVSELSTGQTPRGRTGRTKQVSC